jgi:glutamyl-tRNA synthetase
MEVIRKHALKNALDFGNADSKAVLGKVLAESPELREKVGDILPAIEEVVAEVNAMPKEQLEKEVAKFEYVEKKEKKTGLPELENPENVVLRFAPNPSGPLHLGHARAAILNDEYAKKYSGKLVLRIEDTDPSRVDPDAYAMIEEDLDWLGVVSHEKVIQSERLEIYYEHCRKLLEMGNAYVCTCEPAAFRKFRLAGEASPCRKNSIEENIEKYNKMFTDYKEGEAVVRLKTDMKIKDPAMRDLPLMRISEYPHPRAKGKRVYPLMNFSVTIDDHFNGLTHVLRGKDHIPNIRKQRFIYDYFGWTPPEYIHYGRLKVEELQLSTSKTKEGIEGGEYTGWDDAKLGTIRAMAKRGIKPEAIRRAMIDVGTKPSDINLSWKNLYAYNRELIERDANRYFFVDDPKELTVTGAPEMEISAPLHPDFKDRGNRNLGEITGGEIKFYIPSSDFETIKKGEFVRLMEAFNIEITNVTKDTAEAKFISRELEDARKKKAKLIHWACPYDKIKVKVISPDGVKKGYGEPDLKNVKVDDIIQFERFGFVRLDEIKDDELIFYFTHK